MRNAQHPRWEYRLGTNLDERALNLLGDEGWELVGVEGGSFYLKRPALTFRERVTLDQKRRLYALRNVADEGSDE